MAPQKQYRWNPAATSEARGIRANAVITATAALCVAALAFAHRMPGSISTVKRSASGDTIEIIHRLHTHDAELGVATTLGKRNVSLETLADRAQLALYVEKRFVIAAYADGQIGSRLPLELIGAELDGVPSRAAAVVGPRNSPGSCQQTSRSAMISCGTFFRSR